MSAEQSVYSRISWASILAGAVIAFALFVLLGMLGVALGLSESPAASAQTVANRQYGWLITAVVLPLFLGGWVVGQCTVGTSRREAAVHGLVLWGIVLAVVAYLVIQGVTFGFNTLLEMAGLARVNVQVKLTELKNISAEVGVAAEQVRQAGEHIKEKAAGLEGLRTAWWAFLGLLGSMLAAVVGAVVGASLPTMLRRSTPG
jgi:MFS family permease